MTTTSIGEPLQTLVDKAEIQDVMCRYARGVDRSDWDLVRATYHPDAYDDHGEFKGDVDELIRWLKERFAAGTDGTHFLANCLVEFAGPDTALVETYFSSRRLLSQAGGAGEGARQQDATWRESWGRYVDRFERRGGEWRVARRTVVLDGVRTVSAQALPRGGPSVWGRRNRSDHLYAAQAEIFGS